MYMTFKIPRLNRISERLVSNYKTLGNRLSPKALNIEGSAKELKSTKKSEKRQ